MCHIPQIFSVSELGILLWRALINFEKFNRATRKRFPGENKFLALYEYSRDGLEVNWTDFVRKPVKHFEASLFCRSTAGYPRFSPINRINR